MTAYLQVLELYRHLTVAPTGSIKLVTEKLLIICSLISVSARRKTVQISLSIIQYPLPVILFLCLALKFVFKGGKQSKKNSLICTLACSPHQSTEASICLPLPSQLQSFNNRCAPPAKHNSPALLDNSQALINTHRCAGLSPAASAEP